MASAFFIRGRRSNATATFAVVLIQGDGHRLMHGAARSEGRESVEGTAGNRVIT